jgi:hypothetical protein
MLNALLLFVIIFVVNLLAAELPIVKNNLLNVFIYAAIASLFVAVGTKDRLTWR